MAASSEKTRTKADLRDEAIKRFAVSKSALAYRLEKKLSTFFPNAMWSMKRCQ
jgi:hypothetical protein